jgi:alkylhydroperoxidase family enzyme
MRRYADQVDRLRKNILEGRGKTSRELRAAAAARAAALAGGPAGNTAAIPEDLREYVDTVALHAYRVTDEDVAGLRQAGYSEDEIFEVSIATSLGAALERLEAGLAALDGKRDGEDA